MALFDIIIDIAAKTASFESGIDRIDRRLEAFGENTKRILEVVTAGAFVEFGKKVIEAGSAMEQAAKKAGVSGEAFSEIAYGAKQAGVGTDALAQAFIRMNKALSDARTGGKQQNDALAALGLTIKDLQGLAPEKQFEILADRISRLSDEGDKARAEIILFGRAGADLGELFKKGAAGIEAARNEAKQIGASFSEQQLHDLEEAHKSIERLTAAFEGLATRLVSSVSPAISDFLDNITALISGDKLLKLKEQIAFLKEEQGKSFLAFGYGDIGTGFFTAADGAKKLLELEEKLRIAENGRTTHSRGLSLGGGAFQQGDLPGFLSDITPFNVTQFKTTGNGRGINPVLEQFDTDTKTALDSIYEQYKTTKEKIQNLFDEQIISPDEYTKRMEEAWQKFENASYISPVVISQRTVSLAKYLTEAQQQVHEFTNDFKSSLQSAFDEGGSVGKNFVRNLVKALSDRALYQAIASIGDALASALNKGSTAGSFGGILGQIFGSIFGGSGEISPVVVTQSKVPTYALGTDYVPHTGLAMLHQGESVNTAAETRGGRGVTFAPVYNIDARGATTDLVQALPEILRRNNDALKEDLVQGFLRKKYPLPSR